MTRRGFVTIFALTLVALVGLALAAITVRLGATARAVADARRTAQVQQLILAGMEAARAGGDGAREVGLPGALAAEGAKVRVEQRGGRVVIDVEFAGARRRQVAEVGGGGVKLLEE